MVCAQMGNARIQTLPARGSFGECDEKDVVVCRVVNVLGAYSV